MPRALTEQERCRLCQRLLEKGKDLLFIHGIKKMSVDDVVKAAGMAKGSFYHHFESKEKFLCQLIMEIRTQIFNEMRNFSLRSNDVNNATQINKTREFLMNLFHLPQMKFFFKNCKDINEFFSVFRGDPDFENYEQETGYIDADLFSELIELSGVNTKKLKSGIVHNYMHTLYFMIECDLMIEDDLPQTFDLIMDSLIKYIFNGAPESSACFKEKQPKTKHKGNNE